MGCLRAALFCGKQTNSDFNYLCVPIWLSLRSNAEMIKYTRSNAFHQIQFNLKV